MQRQHERPAAGKRCLGPADLRHAWKEAQHVAVMLRQRGADGAGHRVRQIARPRDVARGVLDGDRKHPAGAFDHIGIHQAGETRPIGGGRHRKQSQVRSQYALQLEAESERQVRLERALVHLVEDHDGDAIEARIRLQPADQQALGDDLDPGRGGDRRVQPGAEPDRAAGRLAEQARHPGGGGPCRQPAWLQHQDAPVAAPGRIEQDQRNDRGLAGARWCNEHGIASGRECREHGRDGFGHGEFG